MNLFKTVVAGEIMGSGGSGAPEYSITATVTGGTVTGDTKIKAGETAELTLIAGTGHTLPAQNAITVTGATIDSYNQSNGKLVLKWAIYNVSVSAACVPNVYPITTSVTNGSATGAGSITYGQTATVLIKGDRGYKPPATITVTGADYTYNAETGAVVFSNPTSAITMTAVCEEGGSLYPEKGEIISMDLNGDGTNEQYLVLNCSGSLAEVLARVNYGNSAFASSGQVYEGGSLDTMLNTTYYNTLSATAKAAIVDRTFKQDSWYWNTSGDPDYHGVYNANNTHYDISLANASFKNEITRHVYALSVQDVIDYLEVTTSMTYDDTTLNMANVQEMFNITSGYVWLRSACAGNASNAMRVSGDYGSVISNGVASSRGARPAFQIDLSQVTWE